MALFCQHVSGINCLSFCCMTLGMKFITFFQHYSSISTAIYLMYHGVVFNIPLKIRYSISITILAKLFSPWEELICFVRLPFLNFLSVKYTYYLWIELCLLIFCYCLGEGYTGSGVCAYVLYYWCTWHVSEPLKLFFNLRYWLCTYVYHLFKWTGATAMCKTGIYLCFVSLVV